MLQPMILGFAKVTTCVVIMVAHVDHLENARFYVLIIRTGP